MTLQVLVPACLTRLFEVAVHVDVVGATAIVTVGEAEEA
jgi:hypothetical protein